jgi:tetratricopeptide (TPR) repeat protein
MSRGCPSLLGAALALALTAGAGTAQDPQNPFRPFDRPAFLAHCERLGASAEDLQRFAADAAEMSVAIAADELLQKLVPALGAAVAAALDADPKAAVSLSELGAGEDPYVRGHARYHLGRVFLDGDDPEAAAQVFADFLRQDRNRTPLDAEVAFFYATALADIPLAGHAIQAFTDYLELFPDAPERFRAVAMQRRAELETQLDDPLHGIADSMKGVERDLKKRRTGDPTQGTQKEIVEKLQAIIEELERQEQQSGGSPSGNSPSTSPAANSAAPPGESRVGSLDKVPGVGDRWGNLKDRDREQIETEVNTKLPERDRERLKRYFGRLGGSGGGGK